MNPDLIHHSSGGAQLSTALGTAVVGSFLGSVNPYLQTLAYCVSIIAGVCAIVKYLRS